MALKDNLKPTTRRGVFYQEHPTRKHGVRKDRQFVLRYTLGGKTRVEVFGWMSEGVTEIDAELKIAEFRANFKSSRGPTSLAEEKAEIDAEHQRQCRERERLEALRKNRPTFRWLWQQYSQTLNKSLGSDRTSFEKHLPDVHGKTPDELVSLDVDRIRRRMEKAGYKPQTIAHALRLVTRMVNYGLSQEPPLCEPLRFKIKLPKVHNEKTEVLSPDEHGRLLAAIADDLATDPWTGRAMLLALTTGMRRGELLRLQWRDVDLDFGFVELRETKSGRVHRIPLNESAVQILRETPRTASPWVFPGEPDADGQPRQRADFNRGSRRIAKAANLPPDFRPFHGLRHHFATALANSGEVSLYMLQRLLCHASPEMTQRYSHLSDESLKAASEVASQLAHRSLPHKKVVALNEESE